MTSIYTKNDALKLYNNGTKENICFFCEDINEQNAKQFHVTNPKNIYKKIESRKESHFYESWSDSSHMMFSLDMDIKGVSYFDARESVVNNIKKVIDAAKKYYGHTYNVYNVIVLESEPTVSIQESNKYSYHIIFSWSKISNT